MQNDHKPNTPEWQLRENQISAERLILSLTADIERAEAARLRAREKADAYAAALAKLGA